MTLSVLPAERKDCGDLAHVLVAAFRDDSVVGALIRDVPAQEMVSFQKMRFEGGSDKCKLYGARMLKPLMMEVGK